MILKSSSYLLTTGPVTTATNERSFSALSYMKTYLRFTTKEDRLNGFTLLYVHRDLIINFEHVIDEFSSKNVVVVVITPPLPRDGGTAPTAMQVHAVNLIEIRLGERCKLILNRS